MDAPTKKIVARKKIVAPSPRALAIAAKLKDQARLKRQTANPYLITIHNYASKVKNYRTAIRAKCIECSGGLLVEVAECQITSCALHPFRMGVNPFNKKVRERLNGAMHEDDEDSEDEE